ncbi:hypothetical protein [Saccharothrix obliqua]|uniref:hypothetical protein n=1 Tax=Saccharothrix obliqua TaxID=2861747 RepID=UPI001C5E2501|nr:hypothetical protein [Saccharothrix obliqua]MBW4718035.1 hypothetical protein [Saccharothrix obliqua]
MTDRGCRDAGGAGAVRQETARQHDARQHPRGGVQEIGGTLAVDARPALIATLDSLRPGDMLTDQEVDALGRISSEDCSCSAT